MNPVIREYFERWLESRPDEWLDSDTLDMLEDAFKAGYQASRAEADQFGQS